MSRDHAASVRARLLAGARARGEEFERTLTRFGAERLLYRLGACTVRERCILKGARLLALWLPEPYRATRDIDLLATGATDDAAIRDLVEEICSVPCPEDGLTFDLSGLTIADIRAEQEYPGRRATFAALLGTARIRVQLDFGFGDALAVPPDELEYPTLLPDLPSPRLRAYPKEASVAEKLHAMVVLETRNSRMRDFHDLWALAGALRFEGPALRRAVETCFDRRRTSWEAETPAALTTAFYEDENLQARWAAYLKGGAILEPPPRRFEHVGERVIGFMGPVRTSIIEGAPFERTWHEGGPWR